MQLSEGREIALQGELINSLPVAWWHLITRSLLFLGDRPFFFFIPGFFLRVARREPVPPIPC